MNETLFFVLGPGLAVLAVLTSIVGVRVRGFPASRAAMAATIAIFATLVVATATFAVRHSADEQQARAAELSTPAP
jgi:hypothetical protein